MHTALQVLLRHLPSILFVAGMAACGGGGSESDMPAGGTGRLPAASPHPADPLSGGQLAPSLISVENAKMGTTSWQLSNPATAHEIEGYASANSVNRGDTIQFMVNTAAPSFNVDIYRMGYYGGAGARLMRSIADVPGRAQAVPCINPGGVIECNWAPSLAFNIPAEGDPDALTYWASGVYLAKLTTNGAVRKDSYIIFVVRDDARQATYISQLPVTTYQAYNYWGGKSLYTGCEKHDRLWQCADRAPPSSMVSFNRPYGPSSNPAAAVGVGAGEFLANVQPVAEGQPISSAGWDYNMVRWMEKQGYDLKYITNLDLHENASVLNGAKAFISTGHDEYYSKPMWDRLVAARAAGINLGFFSSNQIFWQVRFADGSYGGNKKNRIMICYRGGGDPVSDNNLTTNQFRFLGRPEASLIGSQHVVEPIMDDVTITNPGHWLFAGTGAASGSVIRGVLGYEINAVVPGVTPAQTQVLAHSISGRYASDMTYYVDASSSQVFATGTMQWSWGLDNYIPNGLRADYSSPLAQAFTANIFAALGERNLHVFTNAGSGLDLGTPSGKLESAQAVQMSSPGGTQKGNQWRLLASDEAQYYFIVSRATGLCLAASDAQAGAAASTQDCNRLDRQKWRLAESGGNVSLIEKQGGNCLEAPRSSRQAGTGLIVATCNAGSYQQWRRKPLP